MKVRLAKYIADCGVTSRRDAENLIVNGAVSVNGNIVNTPVFFVDDNDKVFLHNRQIQPDTAIKLYMFHKPINTMTTSSDPEHRKTIYDVIDAKYKHLKYIGRLDFKTSGLLLLTNNGDFARKMSLPQNRIPRTYLATVAKHTKSGLDIARKGVVVDGIKYRPMQIEVIDDKNLRITVTEGKKNEIRIVLKHIGAPVSALHRISYGPIKLEKLPVGKIVEIDKKTIDLMLKSF